MRVVAIEDKGYDNALIGGIAAARGKLVIIGDADDSYDFLEFPKFVAKLREGYELVQGGRLPSGGGTVKPNAMPILHRWLGNVFDPRPPYVLCRNPRCLLWPSRIYQRTARPFAAALHC